MHHLKLLYSFQAVQIWHQFDSIFQRSKKLHLKFHHLPKVSEQNVQLQQPWSIIQTLLFS